MGASLASVDHVEVFQRELELSRQVFDSLTQFALGQRGEFVEERLDWWLVNAISVDVKMLEGKGGGTY
jgi:hypothetical protein